MTRQIHERINGQGYPNQLKGRQIAEMAQILGIVDVFDALVTERPYRCRLLPEDAIVELLTSERKAFPRELFKALIEQLSVYPLGTTVRLTTGERGTVVKVNSQFPLRPTVKVNEDEMIGGVGPRHIDLSLTPLVSIVETLNPPVIGQVTFVDEPLKEAASSAPSAASDHFTSLLESLDAIASAIQGVVESSIIASPETQAVGNPPGTKGSESDSVEEQSDLTFRKEIIGLFALEAHEWLAQIQTSIQKLGAGVEGPVRSKLYGFILNGITNLAKSASTIQLFEIEEMASNLLPILRDVGEAGQRSRSETLRSFHEGLDRITTAVHRLTSEHAENNRPKEEDNDHKATIREPDSASQPDRKPLPPSEQTPERFTSNVPLLHALRELQQARARSVHPARDVLETVIDRAEQVVGGQEDQVSTETIERILRDLDRLDEEFFQEVLNRVPAMTDILRHLRQHGPPGFATASHLAPILTHVEALHELAETIQSTTIGMFLQGLKSFLTATAYRKVESLPQRLHAVEERLQALASMAAEQWVTLGRLERAAISEILPK